MKNQYIAVLGLAFSLAACNSSHSSSSTPPATQAPTSGPATPVGTGTNPGSDATGTTGTGPDTTTPTTGANAVLGLVSGLSTTQDTYLKNVGTSVATGARAFEAASETLTAAVNTFCGAYDPAARDAMKAAYKDAILKWEALEFYQIGPFTENNSTLKFKIYAWPQLSNYCKIDEEALLAVDDPEYGLPSNTNRKGLQALEYLIFDSSLATQCPSTNPTKASWEALDEAHKWAARCAFMKPVAAEVTANAQDLVTRWGTVDNNYVSQRLATAEAQHGVMQELFNRLFFLDLEMKNQKIAAPAGQDILYCNKTPSPCPDKDELHYSGLSRDALTANFRSLADIIFGYGEPRTGGLSALLRAANGTATADRSEAAITDLETLNETQTASLDQLLTAKQGENCETSQSSWLCQVRVKIKDIVADFKGDYASILKLSVPAAPQGDND